MTRLRASLRGVKFLTHGERRGEALRRAIGAAVAISVGILVFGGGTAAAHKAKYKSVVEIDAYEFRGAFAGAVGSFDSNRCDSKRKVSLWRENPGAMDGPFGTTRTNAKGEWRIEVLSPSHRRSATSRRR